jgi:glycosyltransferase involved in cell wall biosynthesis
MPLSVVHVSAHYPPYVGGLEKVVESLASYRNERALAVRVLTSQDRDPESPQFSDRAFIERLASIEVAHTTIMPTLPMRLFRLGDDSIVHLHVAQAFAPEAVYVAHVARGLPYIAHLHIDVGPSGAAGFLLRAYKPLVLGRVLRGAQAVIVFTHEQRKTIRSKYGVDPRRIAVIPNGVDESFFFTDPRRLHSRPRLLFVGRLAVQKNIAMLLHALRGISERFDTTIVGSGSLDVELKKLAQTLELKNVRFHGRAHGEDLMELFRQADVFVLPSEREGMPLVLLEAMAMGLPTVATDIPGTRDVIMDRETGILVPLDDSNAMQKALLDVVSDEEQYSRMSKAAQSRAKRYSWDTIGDEFEEVYAHAVRT